MILNKNLIPNIGHYHTRRLSLVSYIDKSMFITHTYFNHFEQLLIFISEQYLNLIHLINVSI